VKEEIETTLRTSQHSFCGKETDEDIGREVEEYEKIAVRYETLANEERKRKRKLSTKATSSSRGMDGRKVVGVKNLENMPIVFGSARENNDEVEQCNPVCTQFNLSFRSSHDCDGILSSEPPAIYRYIERDEGLIHYSDDEDDYGAVGGSNKKRRSRITEITSQKNTSYGMLTELLNTLSFIEKYNRGIIGSDHVSEHPDGEEEDDIVDSTETKSKVASTRYSKPPQPTTTKHAQKKARITSKAAANQSQLIPGRTKSELITTPKWTVLTHIGHLRTYDDLQMKNSSFYMLSGKGGTVTSAQAAIKKILDKDDTLPHFFCDDDIAFEEKEYSKAIRSYRGKSDQERIEKKDHDEKRKLEIREFEYYTTRGHKKLTPLQIDMKTIGQRPINFLRVNEGLPKDLEACPYGIQCPICTPVLHAESGRCFEKETVVLPRFRRVDDEGSYLPPIEVSVVNEELPARRGRERRWAQLKSQKSISALKLAELYNTLGFVDVYNGGLITGRGTAAKDLKKRR
jgi:hypothetical protein